MCRDSFKNLGRGSPPRNWMPLDAICSQKGYFQRTMNISKRLIDPNWIVMKKTKKGDDIFVVEKKEEAKTEKKEERTENNTDVKSLSPSTKETILALQNLLKTAQETAMSGSLKVLSPFVDIISSIQKATSLYEMVLSAVPTEPTSLLHMGTINSIIDYKVRYISMHKDRKKPSNTFPKD